MRTITSPASVVIIACSSLPALHNTWCNTATSIPTAAILNNKSTEFAADVVRNASIIKCVHRAVPVAKSYSFLGRLRTIADQSGKYNNLKNCLV